MDLTQNVNEIIDVFISQLSLHLIIANIFIFQADHFLFTKVVKKKRKFSFS